MLTLENNQQRCNVMPSDAKPSYCSHAKVAYCAITVCAKVFYFPINVETNLQWIFVCVVIVFQMGVPSLKAVSGDRTMSP